MQIYKIVLTDGPCAGKTTTLNTINRLFVSSLIYISTLYVL